MRTMAEVLFWMGRIEVVLSIMILVHILIVWRWRHNSLKRWLAVAWLVFFLVVSITFLYQPVIRPLTKGTGYTWAHLYERIWSDEEALSNILLGWRNVRLQVYGTWLSFWLAGLVGISLLAKVRVRDPKQESVKHNL